jgi:hypothetical protein
MQSARDSGVERRTAVARGIAHFEHDPESQMQASKRSPSATAVGPARHHNADQYGLDSLSAAPGDDGCSACRLDKALNELSEPLRRGREGRSYRR